MLFVLAGEPRVSLRCRRPRLISSVAVTGKCDRPALLLGQRRRRHLQVLDKHAHRVHAVVWGGGGVVSRELKQFAFACVRRVLHVLGCTTVGAIQYGESQ